MTVIPPGDPGAMRGFAFALRTVADRLGCLAADTFNGAFSFEWDGFAAVAFRNDIREVSTGARTIGDRLHSLSDYLVRQAGILELQQEEARRQIAAEQQLAAAHEHRMSP